jgi:NADH-quinone oxidoreductase subunit L
MSIEVLKYSWLIPFIPFCSAIFILLFGKRLKPIFSGVMATIAMSSTFAIWLVSFLALTNVHSEEVRRYFSDGYTWMSVGSFHIDLRFMIDPLSLTMVGFISFVASLIHLYSIGYMKGDPKFSRFFGYLNLFAASMFTLVLADNLLVTFLGWEGVGLCSYLLVSFWFEKPSAAVAGKKAFITNRIGDVGFMLAMFLIVATPSLGSLNYNDILENSSSVNTTSATWIVLLLFIGAMGKSAQFPLHVWLPDAMEGPTPVSALIHAATMVTAGVYLLVRISPLIASASPWVSHLIAIIGAFTALYAATCALTQNDIKRVLAYSTVSQLGYTFLAIGVGSYHAAIFHVVTHAFFKALLFLGSGSVIHSMHDSAHEKHFDPQDMRYMGGLKKLLPITSITFIIGWLAISGIFPFAGFFSKDEILGAAFASGGILGYTLWVVGLMAAIMTAFYMTRQVKMVFFGKPRYGDDVINKPHESPKTMTIPLIVLSIFAVVAGFLNFPVHSREDFSKFIEPAIEGAKHVEVAGFGESKGIILAGVSMMIALSGIIFGIYKYRTRPVDTNDEPLDFMGSLVPFTQNAWYVNSLIARMVSSVGVQFSNLACVFDSKVVDRSVMSLATLTTRSGIVFKKLQNGYVRRYVLIIACATFVMVLLISLEVN